MNDCQTSVKRFNLKGRKIEFSINKVPFNEESTSWIKNAIEDILRLCVKDLNPHDKVGVTFKGKNFSNTRGIGWINFKDCSELSFADVWEMISKIFQSNSEGISSDKFGLSVTSVQMPAGKGNARKSSKKYNTFDEECAKRRGIICIKNEDNLCLPRALVVAKAYADNGVNLAAIRCNKE